MLKEVDYVFAIWIIIFGCRVLYEIIMYVYIFDMYTGKSEFITQFKSSLQAEPTVFTWMFYRIDRFALFAW